MSVDSLDCSAGILVARCEEGDGLEADGAPGLPQPRERWERGVFQFRISVLALICYAIERAGALLSLIPGTRNHLPFLLISCSRCESSHAGLRGDCAADARDVLPAAPRPAGGQGVLRCISAALWIWQLETRIKPIVRQRVASSRLHGYGSNKNGIHFAHPAFLRSGLFVALAEMRLCTMLKRLAGRGTCPT